MLAVGDGGRNLTNLRLKTLKAEFGTDSKATSPSSSPPPRYCRASPETQLSQEGRLYTGRGVADEHELVDHALDTLLVTAERAGGSLRPANRRRSDRDSDDELNSSDSARDDEKEPRPTKRKALPASVDLSPSPIASVLSRTPLLTRGQESSSAEGASRQAVTMMVRRGGLGRLVSALPIIYKTNRGQSTYTWQILSPDRLSIESGADAKIAPFGVSFTDVVQVKRVELDRLYLFARHGLKRYLELARVNDFSKDRLDQLGRRNSNYVGGYYFARGLVKPKLRGFKGAISIYYRSARIVVPFRDNGIIRDDIGQRLDSLIDIRVGEPPLNPSSAKGAGYKTKRTLRQGQAETRYSGGFKITSVGVCKDTIDAYKKNLLESEADLLTVYFIRKILDIEKPDLMILTRDQLYYDISDSQSALFKVVALIIERLILFAAVFSNHNSKGIYVLSPPVIDFIFPRFKDDNDNRFYLSLAFLYIPFPEFGDRYLNIRNGYRREPTKGPSFNSYFYDALVKGATKPLSLALGYTIEVVVGSRDIVRIVESDFTDERGFRNSIRVSGA
ncbi:hypothetical protein G7Y89_g9401 [Cudoniella acicularis]|uniref:Uncharacterized protein n=1 Tax=Cudoniella acicularis TaxID=354080 RepID=A0A8H4W053_9HELO|nr:hypothetical protein G7Y89_g9401 [Cudoniella acicularis]